MDAPTFAAPLALPVPLRSGTITVQSAAVGPLFKFKAQLLPVVELLARDAPQLFDRERLQLIKATGEITANDVIDLCALLEHADLAVTAVELLAPLPRDQVLQLMPDEFAFLFAVVVQVNADFFARALPVLEGVWQRGVGKASEARESGTGSSPAPTTR